MAKLGTNKLPIVGRVQTMERLQEMTSICDQYGWIFTIGLEPDKPEDISDLLKLLKDKRPASRSGPSPSYRRNDYCPCGSGKKYRNCCWDRDHLEGLVERIGEGRL